MFYIQWRGHVSIRYETSGRSVVHENSGRKPCSKHSKAISMFFFKAVLAYRRAEHVSFCHFSEVSFQAGLCMNLPSWADVSKSINLNKVKQKINMHKLSVGGLLCHRREKFSNIPLVSVDVAWNHESPWWNPYAPGQNGKAGGNVVFLR